MADFHPKYYPTAAPTRYPFRTGECKNSFAHFKRQASANWKRWGQAHFDKHHVGTPVREVKGE